MWCERCRRDYEPAAPADSSGAPCPECAEALATHGAASSDSNRDPIRLFEDLQDDVLLGVRREGASKAKSEVLRIDAAHPLTFVPSGTSGSDEVSQPTGHPSVRSGLKAGAAGFLGAVFGYLGVIGLAVGAGLLWYGQLQSRPELEQPGWLTVMVGQIGLLLGWAALVWSGSRTAEPEVSRQLDHLHERLSALESNRTAAGPLAPSFYHHLAAGAPVPLLLAELRGQLDLLATHLGQQHRAQP